MTQVCVFFLNKRHNNNRENHGKQVRKNANTYSDVLKKPDAEPRRCVSSWAVTAIRPPSHLGNRGDEARFVLWSPKPCFGGQSLQAPRGTWEPLGFQGSALGPWGCAVLSWLGWVSGLDLRRLSDSHTISTKSPGECGRKGSSERPRSQHGGGGQ